MTVCFAGGPAALRVRQEARRPLLGRYRQSCSAAPEVREHHGGVDTGISCRNKRIHALVAGIFIQISRLHCALGHKRLYELQVGRRHQKPVAPTEAKRHAEPMQQCGYEARTRRTVAHGKRPRVRASRKASEDRAHGELAAKRAR